MIAKSNDYKYDDLVIFKLEELLKIKNVLNYIVDSKKDFPNDYRYVLLKEDINDNMIKIVLKYYSDEELDMLFYTLEARIYKMTYEGELFIEDDIFNIENDKKVLKKCTNELKKRNLI